MNTKFEKLIDRLTNKVHMSATPVKGFIVGLSGTDSVVAFILLSEVVKRFSRGIEVVGLHYRDGEHKITEELMIPWLRERYPKAIIHVRDDEGAETDQLRWARLHMTAIANGYWTVSTVNATEQALGTFGIMANSASIKPITSLYKSEVLQVCLDYGVPQEVIQRSLLPDCLCGRDEFAAENIPLIDDVLRYSVQADAGYTAGQIIEAMDYIRDTKRANEFKNRTPYNV